MLVGCDMLAGGSLPTPPPTVMPLPTPVPPQPTATPLPPPSMAKALATLIPPPTPTAAATATAIPTPLPPTSMATALPTLILHPTPVPRAKPRLTPILTPTPTPVPWKELGSEYGDAHFTVAVPVSWPAGRVTITVEPHTGTPALFVYKHVNTSLRHLEQGYLSELGDNLPFGSYFVQHYLVENPSVRNSFSELQCRNKGGLVRRSAMAVDLVNRAGVAVHVDVCFDDLPRQFEPGNANQEVSRRIIRNLRQKVQ